MNRQRNMGSGSALMALVVLLAITTPVMAVPNVKGSGTLHAVEEQGKIVFITTQADSIDQPGGYQVAAYAQILDGMGRKTTLKAYTIPTKVEFEFEYTPAGPLIKKIREIRQ